ncbi:MAG: D-alanyl-D-alanine carboxypeptidase family protein [Armatimonadota bacterium]|nr:D-alanyl-D-alanine carboxypeptidase family protein [Armatimonadota bacterium]MDR7428205.1 D-alanyl-D-alanine carboxypeptidase family protein [Armatimonadota bacterium]MDR7464397.1 D-alanyl-D-alanine carboxypeptidase family protein [Armatimonadota bacterium]MDR7470735.1 D-alanyl-D-alanine carboxypeptidase family protein [Armatimonadota bacterium]MDR7475772.1 D-alanyl-D-alanine carboxypeptidase family protein [Armatimonadota bacterium]
MRLHRESIVVALLAAILLPLSAPAAPGEAAPGEAAPALDAAALPPPVVAASAVLMDARTGAVLYARAADIPRPPASTTKILTALVALEHLHPDDPVPISRRAAEQRSGSSIGLEVGERWPARDLLAALLLASANDAAVALAEAAAGSVEGFADLMNRRARAAGARRSHFVVPHGLYHPDHLTTARDLALITRAALRRGEVAQLVRRQTFTWLRPGLPPRVVVNRNRLLWTFPGADGVKTGWIPQSGQCLVASATREGWQLIAVVLDSADVFGDAARLLGYGFTQFHLARVAAMGTVLARAVPPGADQVVAAAAPADVELVVPRRAALRSVARIRTDLQLPIAKGVEVGTLAVYAQGRLATRVPLLAVGEVRSRPLWRQVLLWMRGLLARPSPASG